MKRHFGLLTSIAVGVALLVAAPDAAQGEQGPRCPDETKAPPAKKAQQVPEPQARSNLTSRAVRIDFGSKRMKTDRTIGLTATPRLRPRTRMFADVGADLTRADGGDSFPVEGIVLKPSVSQAGNLRLSICLDPERPEQVEVGRYTGVIELIGEQIEATAIPLEVTLKSSVWVAILWSTIGIVVGIMLKALADLKSSLGKAPSWKQLFGYLGEPWVIGAILIGALGALAAIYGVYDTNETWGTTGDGGKLLAGAVVVQVTGMTAVDVVKPKAEPAP